MSRHHPASSGAERQHPRVDFTAKERCSGHLVEWQVRDVGQQQGSCEQRHEQERGGGASDERQSRLKESKLNARARLNSSWAVVSPVGPKFIEVFLGTLGHD